MYPVPDATDRFYIGSIPDLTTEIFHMCVDRAIIEIVLISDNFFHEFFPLHNGIFVLYEVGEYEEFRLGDFYLLCTDCKQIP